MYGVLLSQKYHYSHSKFNKKATSIKMWCCMYRSAWRKLLIILCKTDKFAVKKKQKKKSNQLIIYNYLLVELQCSCTPERERVLQCDSQHHREYVALHRWPPTHPPVGPSGISVANAWSQLNKVIGTNIKPPTIYRGYQSRWLEASRYPMELLRSSYCVQEQSIMCTCSM